MPQNEMKQTLRHVFHIDHLVVTLITMGLIALLVAAVNLEFLNPVGRALEGFSMTDIYYQIQQSDEQPTTCRQITLVDMTPLTRRDDLARVVQQIDSMRPAVLGVDIIFEGPSGYDEADELLAEAFLNAQSRMVLATKLTDYDSQRQTYANAVSSFFADGTGVVEGAVNAVGNPHQTLASYSVALSYDGRLVPTMPALLAQSMGVEPSATDQEEHTIRYENMVFPIVEWDDLAQHRHDIEGHVVLLGTTKEERDKHFTPIGKMSGLEVLAYSTLSMMHGTDMTRLGPWASLLLALLVGCITNVLTFFVSEWLERRDTAWAAFFTSSEFYFKIISFIVMVVVTGIFFVLYMKHDFYIGIGLALGTSALEGEGRLLYMGLLAVLYRKLGWRWTRRSLYFSKIKNEQ